MEASTMITDWVTTGLTALVIFLAAAVHGITRFGYAQVSMGLLPLFRNPGEPVRKMSILLENTFDKLYNRF